MNEADPGVPLWFPIFFVGNWLFVCAVFAEVSRWPALAKRFPGGERPKGPVLRGQVLRVGIVPENNVTQLILTPLGLYMRAQVLFRFRHRPICVPWAEIKYISTQRFLWTRSYKLQLGGGITTIRIADRAFRAIEPYLETPSSPG